MRKYGVLLLLGGLLPHVALAGEGKEAFFFMFLIGAGGALILLALYALLMLLTAALVKSRAAAWVLCILYTAFVLVSEYWCFNDMLNPVFVGSRWRERSPWAPDVVQSAVVVGIGMVSIALLAARIWSKRHQRRQRAAALARELGL